jgi:hypothetical protein
VVPHLLDREAQQDELWLIELATRRVLDRQPVASGARRVRLCRHPDGQAVGVCWAFTWEEPVCWARPAAGRIQLRAPEVAGVLQDIHPGGRESVAAVGDNCRHIVLFAGVTGMAYRGAKAQQG